MHMCMYADIMHVVCHTTTLFRLSVHHGHPGLPVCRHIQGKPCVCVCVCDCQPIIIQLSVHLSRPVRKGGHWKLRKKLHLSAKPKSDTISRGSLTQPVTVLAPAFQKCVGQNGDRQVYSPVRPEGDERATFGIRDCPCVFRRR